jgi:lysophospholipase L1-like esterase
MNTVIESPTINLVVIGDSAGYGVGDQHGDEVRGWAWYLSRVFYDSCNYQNFSRPGAQSTEVLQVQLPLALASAPDICAVIVGGNDLLRNGFSPAKLYQNLMDTCTQLMHMGSEVVLIELHDPNKLLKLPKLLKRVLHRRVESVNQTYYRVADELGALLVRTREIPNVHDLQNWHVDRMHPGTQGHQLLAREIATVLRKRGWSLQLPQLEKKVARAKSQDIKWLLRNGLPWFLKRSVDLLPAALILMGIESIRVIIEVTFQRGENRNISLPTL